MLLTFFKSFTIAQNKINCHRRKQVTVLVTFHSQLISVEIASQSIKKGWARPVAQCELDSLDEQSKLGWMGRGYVLVVPCLLQWRMSLHFHHLW